MLMHQWRSRKSYPAQMEPKCITRLYKLWRILLIGRLNTSLASRPYYCVQTRFATRLHCIIVIYLLASLSHAPTTLSYLSRFQIEIIQAMDERNVPDTRPTTAKAKRQCATRAPNIPRGDFIGSSLIIRSHCVQ